MLHELENVHFNNSFIKITDYNENDKLILFTNNKVILYKEQSDLFLPSIRDFDISTLELKYVGNAASTNYFTSVTDPVFDEAKFESYEMYRSRSLLNQTERWISSLCYQLYRWFIENKFCGVCGTDYQESQTERALYCSSCKHTIYPKISPAIIVLIKNKNKILLARNAGFPAKFFSLIAGYVDMGETLEEAVTREVMEEVGLKVKNIRYFASQPWAYSSSMMIGYTAELNGNNTITMDQKEIIEADWFTKETLPLIPGTDSIAGKMIRLYCNSEI